VKSASGMALSAYEVRISQRARRPRIIVRPNGAVEIVLPRGVPQAYAQTFFIEKRGWVEQVRQRFSQNSVLADTDQILPEKITLECCGDVFDVSYQATSFHGVQCFQQGQSLCLRGNIQETALVHDALQCWLKQRAKQVLPKMLEVLAEEYGFFVRRIGVRMQKRRWGSCSGAGHVQLNAKLLLLPQALVHHVMLHELAHLQHPNHSPQFWACVAKMDADCTLHRQQMRDAYRWIPHWVTSGE